MRIEAKIKPNTSLHLTLLIHARKSKGLTQRQVGKSLGVTHMAISHWEKGIREPKLTQLDRWVNLLGLEIVIKKKIKPMTYRTDGEVIKEFDNEFGELSLKCKVNSMESKIDFAYADGASPLVKQFIKSKIRRSDLLAFRERVEGMKDLSGEFISPLREGMKIGRNSTIVDILAWLDGLGGDVR